MIEIHNNLNAESLRRLAALRGATLQRLFGVNLDVHLLSEDVSIETDSGTITVWGGVDSLGDWEGFEGQYAVLHVDAGVPSLYGDHGVNVDSGRAGLYFHAGDRIDDVSIVRECVRKVVTGESEWEYTTDTAIVFELSNGAFAISKTALDGEMLHVAFAESFDQLDIPASGAFWFHWDQLGTEFLRSSETLSLDDLIDAQGI